MSDADLREASVEESARALVALERVILIPLEADRRTIGQQADQLGARLEQSQADIVSSAAELCETTEALAALEGDAARLIERRGRQFDAMLRNQQIEQLIIEDDWLVFRTVPIVVELPAASHHSRPRRYNIGRWFVRIQVPTAVVRVLPAEGQQREHGGTMLHPHIYRKALGPPEYPERVEANEVCWGNLKTDVRLAMKRQEYGLLLEYVLHLLTNIQPDDPAFFAAVTEIGTPID